MKTTFVTSRKQLEEITRGRLTIQNLAKGSGYNLSYLRNVLRYDTYEMRGINKLVEEKVILRNEHTGRHYSGSRGVTLIYTEEALQILIARKNKAWEKK